MPTTRRRLSPSSVTRPTVEPTSTLAFLAVSSISPISPAPRGAVASHVGSPDRSARAGSRRRAAGRRRRADALGLAVLVDDQRAERVDLAGRRCDAGHLADPRQHGAREGLLEAAVVFAHRPQIDDDVVLDVDSVEDLRERAVDLTGHHEGARDHRDAEHDRERGQQGAQRPRAQACERESEHRRLLQRLDLVEDLVARHAARGRRRSGRRSGRRRDRRSRRRARRGSRSRSSGRTRSSTGA